MTKASLTEEIILQGHIIDSLILPKVFDTIMDLGGDFKVEEIRVGRHKLQTSFTRMKVFAEDEDQLHRIVAALQEYGAELISGEDVNTEPAPKDGALPEDFYSTTNLPTQVRLGGHWVDVTDVEMDLAIVIDREAERAFCKPINEVRAGEAVAVGHGGIRVIPMERARRHEIFSFMGSPISSEKPKRLAISRIAQEMQAITGKGGKILFVAGPAIIHSGASKYLARLISAGYVQALFGGNAIAVHDVESVLYGTSLGTDLANGLPVEGGHRNHMRAINAIRRVGSLEKAVEMGILREGIVYECLTKGVPMILAGSVRDDGPMPGVITDTVEAQRKMREEVRGVELAIMVATMLHSIATGNLLPAHTKVVVVDINPAVVTKLADRGTFQAVGLITDAELFLRELVEELGLQ